jgi:hypothetical protein
LDGGQNMPQISKAIFGVIAVALSLGAVQLASGRDLSDGLQVDEGTAPTTTINRATKTDRAAAVAGPAIPMRTIQLRLQGISNTSILIRLPAVQARNGSSVPPVTKWLDRKMAVACEPVASVLTEAARQLEPGRCVT